jgi:hypothetical protein
MNPIASIQATEMTRRALRGSGPHDVVTDERRPGRRRGRRSAPAAVINLVG